MIIKGKDLRMFNLQMSKAIKVEDIVVKENNYKRVLK
jgi:hypothetical protein